MKVRRAFCALALASTSVIGIAAPASASAVTTTAPVRFLTTLNCGPSHPVNVTTPLTTQQVTVLRAVVLFINSHPRLFGTFCTVTVTP